MSLNLFSIQPWPESTREILTIRNSAHVFGFDTTITKEPIPGSIPIGSVEYCELALPEAMRDITPKPMYPQWVQPYLRRHVRLYHVNIRSDPTLRWRCFAKRADVWKSDKYPAGIRQPGDKLDLGQWWISDVISIVDEWRYYCVDGVVISSGWYDGESNDMRYPPSAPTLPFALPSDYSGTLDCGLLRDGRIAVIESHWPIACGWYGEDSDEYTYWQIEAWRRLIKQ